MLGDRWLPPVLMLLGLLLMSTGGILGLASSTSTEGRVEYLVSLPEPGEPPPIEPLEPSRMAQPITIRRGATFGGLASRYGLPADVLLKTAQPYYDLTKIRPDRELSVSWVSGDPNPVELSYAIDVDTTLVLIRDEREWQAVIHQVEYASEVEALSFSIQRSLWQDGLDAGLPPAGLARLAEVFEYEVDFNTELRAGARFSLVADMMSAPERPNKLGDIHAVRLSNAGRTWTAFRFELPDGTESWYQPDGTSLRKPFLRSPLEFSRVTSGFNPKRFHPILKRPRPHNGTDFGAPTGTPVRVVADGKVVRAGWAGGHGRFVKVEHDGAYATSYSHLSRIDVKAGSRVRQGQVIGAVGATGMATGPHLHYQMWHKGRFVDPMKIKLPNQAPLPVSAKPAFAQTVERWSPTLDRAEHQSVRPAVLEPEPDPTE
ncbi:MAG: M23 family metallopeptidase [Deltaproteobacteria bacterium]|nr:MAG: M23 family metallopeptidase [Deltaproteobacteria bacterium]